MPLSSLDWTEHQPLQGLLPGPVFRSLTHGATKPHKSRPDPTPIMKVQTASFLIICRYAGGPPPSHRSQTAAAASHISMDVDTRPNQPLNCHEVVAKSIIHPPAPTIHRRAAGPGKMWNTQSMVTLLSVRHPVTSRFLNARARQPPRRLQLPCRNPPNVLARHKLEVVLGIRLVWPRGATSLLDLTGDGPQQAVWNLPQSLNFGARQGTPPVRSVEPFPDVLGWRRVAATWRLERALGTVPARVHLSLHNQLGNTSLLYQSHLH